MLRKVMWMGLVAVCVAAARRLAVQVWRIATGEEPPVKR
jgi:hypothetical protein